MGSDQANTCYTPSLALLREKHRENKTVRMRVKYNRASPPYIEAGADVKNVDDGAAIDAADTGRGSHRHSHGEIR
ncbi:hypothetical protein R1sor_019090 [Riccia sorocarpa]|uniref:Uncharacterized protein n=1 Tax=Riccia sorocarpa TaxID=122646 RepID=A0ABD3IBL5_9MARC